MTHASYGEPLVETAAAALADLAGAGSGLLLAVSGGSDSLGLMLLAQRAAPALGLELAVGFVDHGLRAGTAAEWEVVERAARRLGLRAERAVVPADEAAQGRATASVQQWAREVRYRELTELARRRGLPAVATGHTLDDQAETLLLRLVRGTGVDGLGGMEPTRDLADDVRLIRPLLGLTRDQIRAFLLGQGASWIDDPSNALAAEARGISSFFDSYFESGKVFENLRLARGYKVKHEVFRSLPRSTWTRLVRHVLRRARGDLRRLERTHVAPIEELIASEGAGGPLPLPGDAEVYVHRGSLFVFPGSLPGRPTGSGQATVSGPGRWTARFAALGAIAEIRAPSPELVEDLEVRARRPGDRVLGSERKLKELLSEHRVPGPYRDQIPVLASGDRIVACPALLRSRREGVEVSWLLDDSAPFLDIDFPRAGGS
jgi:tRNA(Ile)-lysidine synthase